MLFAVKVAEAFVGVPLVIVRWPFERTGSVSANSLACSLRERGTPCRTSGT